MVHRGFDLMAGTGYAASVMPGRVPLSEPATTQPTVLVFDSGLGGLTVEAELARALPAARIVYAADDAAFPYGAWDEAALVERILVVMERLIGRHRPDIVVIACNTACTIALPALRARFPVPFVGTVPAIKPAAERTRSGLISVIATMGCIRRDYTRALIETYAAGCMVTPVGSPHLATLCEAALRGETVEDAAIAAEIAPCFVERGGRRTDTVVLGCTHYPLLLDRLKAVAPWPVTWIDSAAAIARRAASLLGERPMGTPPAPPVAVFTSGAGVTTPLRDALARRGIGEITVASIPVTAAVH